MKNLFLVNEMCHLRPHPVKASVSQDVDKEVKFGCIFMFSPDAVHFEKCQMSKTVKLT